MLTRMLREDGFNVELAVDGAAAIDRLARSPLPNVLITDLRIPHADSMTVTRYARSRQADLPVLIITNYPDLVPRGDALDPAPTVLSKPLDYARLTEVLWRINGA